MIEKNDIYSLQTQLLPDNCKIVRDVDYSDIYQDGIIIKNLFDLEIESFLTISKDYVRKDTLEDDLQNIIVAHLADIDIFKKIGNKVYFELIVDSQTDASKKYVIDMIIADLENTMCKTCGHQYVLDIIEGKIILNGSKCLKCVIKCPQCNTLFDMIKFNAILLFSDIACGFKYSDITVEGGFDIMSPSGVKIVVKTTLPKKYFRC